ncbi:ldehyde dehydrogenase [Diaporthe amygdali]|uniref:ldehyde dehydrogenase n=1 Tax=Phomopsis amygdali TaxID=1214568 RepID=UPI0022FEB006|nr:ldehyde dehydrogenase [Diaporthe amygdali]KAJ0122577.1 ldehyde dehydrogenase [Diaporthe amygdali]
MSSTAEYKIGFTTFQNVINNELTSTARTRHGVNPSTEETLPEVPLSGQNEVDQAVAAARAAFPAWRAKTWDERASHVQKLADAIEANHDEIRDLLVTESGKAFSTANMEMQFSIGHLRVTSGLRIPDETVEDTDERTAVVRYRPLGVGCAIVPWNWPLLLGVGKIGPGVMAGNTIIVKPSPYAPYTLIKVAELAAKIFPPGVIQVLSGDEALGPLLTLHPGINKISFTGSTATGKKVAEACAKTIKRLTLELGGNDAAIVCDDADLAKVVPKVSTLALISSGQICMNIKRIYVHEKIYDDFMKAIVDFIRNNLKHGPAADPNTAVGPVQNSMQYAKVLNLFEAADKEGWKIATGGLKEKKEGKGFILPPTIIDDPAEGSRIEAEEPFGPILPVMRWSNEADVVRRANGFDSGLGASVWSSDIAKATKIADQLEAGSVWVNTHFEVGPHMPFGGHKQAGLGMEWGVVGLKGWCNPQAFWTRKD